MGQVFKGPIDLRYAGFKSHLHRHQSCGHERGVQGRFQYSVGSVLGELKVPRFSERRIRNAYLNELQLRTTCPIDSSEKWWDTTYVLYDLAEPPSKTDWYVDSSEWEC
ncbi:unnamed protein product [Penicillium camemberti]|uniref:Str. FM013 n=1 Tax=Penicillium camemberti (strain FM 013) TaxID=1429867 RepID=A0A0G4PBL9_PENC3|nr:unnamed protein product [Penicillium camemberti]